MSCNFIFIFVHTNPDWLVIPIYVSSFELTAMEEDTVGHGLINVKPPFSVDAEWIVE